MSNTQEISPEELEEGPLTPRRIGLVAGGGDVLVFAYLGHVMFEDALFGAVVGLLVGGGIALFLPVFIWANASGGFEEMAPPDAHPFRSFHRLAGGLVLAPAGILLFAVELVEFDRFVGAAGVLLVATVGYAVLAVLLPNAQPKSVTRD